MHEEHHDRGEMGDYGCGGSDGQVTRISYLDSCDLGGKMGVDWGYGWGCFILMVGLFGEG